MAAFFLTYVLNKVCKYAHGSLEEHFYECDTVFKDDDEGMRACTVSACQTLGGWQ